MYLCTFCRIYARVASLFSRKQWTTLLTTLSLEFSKPLNKSRLNIKTEDAHIWKTCNNWDGLSQKHKTRFLKTTTTTTTITTQTKKLFQAISTVKPQFPIKLEKPNFRPIWVFFTLQILICFTQFSPFMVLYLC